MSEPEPIERIIEQEQTVRELIQARLAPVDVVRGDQQEMISYRLAEIFVSARSLYTHVLPRFVEEERPGEDAVFEAFGDVRMHLLHMRDLISDFEEAFLESLTEHQESVEGREHSQVDDERAAEDEADHEAGDEEELEEEEEDEERGRSEPPSGSV